MSALRVATVAVFSALVVAPAAHAAGHGPTSINTTVPPGGNSTVTSPTLDPSAKSATVDVAPSTPADEQFFENMQVVLSLQPSPGKRLLMCIGLYINVAHGIDESVELQFPEQVHPLAVLLLTACLEQAAALDRAAQVGPPRRAASTAAKCGRVATQTPATFTKVGKRYKAEIDGSASPLARKGRLKVTCKRKGTGISLTARPAKKGKTLRSVVGKQLLVGVYNPLDATGSGTLKLTFRG